MAFPRACGCPNSVYPDELSPLPQVSSVQSLSSVLTLCDPMDCSTPGLLSITNSWSLLKLMSIESVMRSNHLVLCRPLLPPSVFPSIRVFSKESVPPGHRTGFLLQASLPAPSLRSWFPVFRAVPPALKLSAPSPSPS